MQISISIDPRDAGRIGVILARCNGLKLQQPAQDSEVPVNWQNMLVSVRDIVERIDKYCSFLGVEKKIRSDIHKNESSPEDTLQSAGAVLDELGKEINSLCDEGDKLEDRKKENACFRRGLEALQGVDIALDDLEDTDHMKFILGLIPIAKWMRLSVPMARTSFVILPIQRTRDEQQLVLAAAHPINADVVNQILRSADCQLLALPDTATGSPTEELERLLAKEQEIERQMENWGQRKRELSVQWAGRLQTMRQQLALIRRGLECVHRYGHWAAEGCSCRGSAAPETARPLVRRLDAIAEHPRIIFITEEKQIA